MSETLGRGEFTDERRIEHEAKRPHENPPPAGDPASSPAPAIADLRREAREAIQSILSGGAMSDATSFSHQVELLLQLKQYLTDFQDRLLGVSDNYRHKIETLHQAGMMDETCHRYVENELAETQSLIGRLVEHIGANDIPRVESEIAYLEQKL